MELQTEEADKKFMQYINSFLENEGNLEFLK
jgi:hypothetical protein